jgi:hypothetical protein
MISSSEVILSQTSGSQSIWWCPKTALVQCEFDRPRIRRIRRVITDLIRVNPLDPFDPWSIPNNTATTIHLFVR